MKAHFLLPNINYIESRKCSQHNRPQPGMGDMGLWTGRYDTNAIHSIFRPVEVSGDEGHVKKQQEQQFSTIMLCLSVSDFLLNVN